MHHNEKIYKFLERLARHNDREWFKAHKDEYDELRALWLDDLSRLTALMSRYEPAAADPRALKAFRIYRDTRFSKDKTPYKLFFSASVYPHPGGPHDSAAWYMQMGLGDGFTGSGLYGGIWCPPGPTLKKLRRAVVDNIEEFEQIVNEPRLAAAAPGWCADALKTVPRDWPKDHPQAPLLRLKEYGKFMPRGREYFADPQWVERTAENLELFKPLIDFINYSIYEE